ncbi:hypothetical protein ABKN59_003272 [Abortiporus biennis]
MWAMTYSPPEISVVYHQRKWSDVAIELFSATLLISTDEDNSKIQNLLLFLLLPHEPPLHHHPNLSQLTA